MDGPQFNCLPGEGRQGCVQVWATMNYEHLCIGFCVNLSIHFSGTDVLKPVFNLDSSSSMSVPSLI